MNTGMTLISTCTMALTRALTRATILGTLCTRFSEQITSKTDYNAINVIWPLNIYETDDRNLKRCKGNIPGQCVFSTLHNFGPRLEEGKVLISNYNRIFGHTYSFQCADKVPISSTFYEQLLRPFPFTKKN